MYVCSDESYPYCLILLPLNGTLHFWVLISSLMFILNESLKKIWNLRVWKFIVLHEFVT